MCAAVQWCVIAPELHVLGNDTHICNRPGASQSISINALKGEQENVQVIILPEKEITVFSISHDSHSNSDPAFWTLTAHQIGYVYCNHSAEEPGSGGGWRPDPLLPIDPEGATVHPGSVQPFWLAFHIPLTAVPSVHSGN
eukprot:gene2390-13271_t